MRFEILGPLRVSSGTTEVPITAGRDRTLLATLLLHADQSVSVDQLIDAIWEDTPPARARNQVQKCVLQLRRTLAVAGHPQEVIVTEPAGYRLSTASVQVDLREFRGLVTAARKAIADDNLRQAREHYRQALALWRGPALGDLPRDRLRPAAAALDEERQQVLTERIDLELSLGGGGELVAELTDLVHRYPYQEGLHRARMLALYRGGRQADALAAYQHARTLLVAELGQEPGPPLRELHRQILAGDPHLTLPGSGARTPRRCCLPRAVSDFTGRRGDLAWLLTAAAPAGGSSRVLAVDGMPGIGKTALALHAAHLLSPQYPDAQLFIDLHGHSEQRPVEPAAAVATLLRQLGIPAATVPSEPEERFSLWRSELADRRVLVVLDNAATAAQVRPLLPATTGCLTLLTSRRRLVGLEDAAPLSLQGLDDDEAVALLTTIAGDRVRDEPQPALEVARRCGHLPLAIRLAAARLAHRPHWLVRDLADRLSDARHLLSEFAAEDRTVADAVALSYTPLPDDQQRVFRLLGLHPGDSLEAYATAALAGLRVDEARRTLEDLVDRNLLLQPEPGRYRFHDLVREYARQLAETTDPEPERRAAMEQMLDFYLHATARTVQPAHAPDRRSQQLRLSPPERPDLVADADTWGTSWIEAEHLNLVTAVCHAGAAGFDGHAWRLARALWLYLFDRGHLDDLFRTHHCGLSAAVRSGDDLAVASIRTGLASAYLTAGEFEAAATNLQETILYRERWGGPRSAAGARNNLAGLHYRMGNHHEALRLAEETLAIRLQDGDTALTAITLANLSNMYSVLGHHDAAIGCLRRAIARHRRDDDPPGLALAVGNLGSVRARMGDWRPAERLLRLSLRQRRQLSTRKGLPVVLSDLAAVCRATSRLDEAMTYHLEALDLTIEVGDRPDECMTRNEYGYTLLARGDAARALEQHRAALALASTLGMKYEHARALDGIAACLRTTDPAAAREHWQQALSRYGDMGVPERHEVAGRLADLSAPPLPPPPAPPLPPPPAPAYRIDNERNRDLVDEAAAVAYLAALAGRNDLPARGQRVATLRALGRLNEAEQEGRDAYDLAVRTGTPRQQVAALLRLAHVMQYRTRWRDADAMFAEALARARELDDPLMLAFAHQHAGRNHVDQGRHDEAVAAFRAALELREAHDAPQDQLESSRGAIRAARQRLSASAHPGGDGRTRQARRTEHTESPAGPPTGSS
jgi:DNA-binding SARP family transcriptional activator/tetratricopeptide (TPR) repeat protein